MNQYLIYGSVEKEDVNIESIYNWVGEDKYDNIYSQKPSIKLTLFGDNWTATAKGYSKGEVEYRNGYVKFNSEEGYYELRDDEYHEVLGTVKITSRGPILKTIILNIYETKVRIYNCCGHFKKSENWIK